MFSKVYFLMRIWLQVQGNVRWGYKGKQILQLFIELLKHIDLQIAVALT